MAFPAIFAETALAQDVHDERTMAVLPADPTLRETLFDEMKRYVRFSPADERALAAFRPHAAPHFARIAADFYERIREHEGAHDVFTGEEQVERLKRTLVRWMDRVLSGPHDVAYFEESSKIGQMHVKIGLPQHYMFTAMALIRIALVEIADATMQDGAVGVRYALNRALDLELAIMLETYRTDLLQRVARSAANERAEVDRTLARTEHRYRHAVELVRVLLVGLDCDGIVRLFNREAERVTGFGREEVLGLPFAEKLLPSELRQDHGEILARAAGAATQTNEILESSVLTKSGKVRDVRWHISSAASAAEKAEDDVVLFAAGLDVTEQNALTTRARQNEKLAAVGTLAAGLAHEIRNPLNGAHLHLTYLARGLRRAGIKDSETLDAIRVVEEEIKRLSALVTEFLDFARPKPIAKKPASIIALCTRAAQLVTAPAADAHATIRLDLPNTDIELEVDPDRIEQVLLNLLQNAIEAVAATGGGVVVLRARRQPRHVTLEVEDEGPGLPNPTAPIFDPFYSTKPQGTGLGLAIVHRIVTDHDGSVDVSSRPGRTIFRVTLPLRLTA